MVSSSVVTECYTTRVLRFDDLLVRDRFIEGVLSEVTVDVLPFPFHPKKNSSENYDEFI